MKSLRYKIFLYTLAPLFVVLFSVSIISIYNKSLTEHKILIERLNTYRYLLESGDLTFETSKDKEQLSSLLGEKIEFSRIIDSDRNILFSSEIDDNTLSSKEDAHNIEDAFNGVDIIKNDYHYGDKSLTVVFSPIVVNGKIVAVIHQGISNEDSASRIWGYSMFIITINIIGIIISFVFIFFLLNISILDRILKLKKFAMDIESGNLNSQIDVGSQDEIGELSTIFNSMTKKLRESYTVLEEKIKERTRELEEERGSLERKVSERTIQLEKMKNDLKEMVRERTKKLNDKLDELQRINKLMINRELKMIELKKEIDILKNNKIIN